MITQFQLHNWKSFGDATLYIDPLTFLVGTNASGKSNALDALSFVRNITQGMPIGRAISRVRGGEDVVIRKGEDSFTIKVVITDQTDSYEYAISVGHMVNGAFTQFQESLNKTVSGETMCVFKSELDADKMHINTNVNSLNAKMRLRNSSEITSTFVILEAFSVGRKSKKIYSTNVIECLRNIFVLYAEPQNMRGYVPVSQRLKEDASNIAGVVAAFDDVEKSRVERLLTEYVRLFPEKDIKRVWAEKVGELKKDAMLYCEEVWTDDPVVFDASGMSDGTLRFIAIVISLLTRPHNSLLAIEEVDNGLHPSRSEKLVEVLRKLGNERHIDVLCTTHNPTLIDALGNKMLPFISYVKRGRNGESDIKLLEDLTNLAKLMAANSMGDMMIKGLL